MAEEYELARRTPAVTVGDATEAYAAYLNAPRDHFDTDEQKLLDEDTDKAREAMEIAWLEAQFPPELLVWEGDYA